MIKYGVNMEELDEFNTKLDDTPEKENKKKKEKEDKTTDAQQQKNK